MHRRIIVTVSAVVLTGLLAGLTAVGAWQPPAPAPPARKASWPECGTGPLPQVRDLEWMAGSWNVTVKWFAPPPSDKSFDFPTESLIEPVLGGTFLQERIIVPLGQMRNDMIGLRSFDRFRGVYRIVWLDEISTLADIYEGTATDGSIVVTNLKSGTAYVGADGVDTFLRITQRPGADRDGFTLTWEASQDAGATWRKTAEYHYTRKP